MNQAYQLSKIELRQLQKAELEVLIELDRICRKYNIQYSLDGGTLLGAVRHKGFIPWDDDIDVIMLRKEYAKFRNACREELDQKRFFLQDYQTDPYYRWGYAKIRCKDTEFVRQGQEHLKQRTGIFIDVFAVDNVPDGYVSRRLHHVLCYFMRKILYSEVGKVNADNILTRGIYQMLSKIPRNHVFHVRNCLAARSNRTRTELISHYTLEYPRQCRYGLPRKCFDEMIELDFEGRKFFGFKNYHRYLSMYYGDYMTLPPVEKRVPHLEVSKLKLPVPKVSIIIPVYNGSNYLKEAIDSALAQTYSNIEVIVVNDGSLDDGATEKIALSYGHKIRYLKKENGGTASALNMGIKNMEGEYFSWLSHDDVYYPDKIKKEVEVILESGDLTKIVQCEYDFYDMRSRTYTPTDFYKVYSVEQLTNSVFSLLQLQIHACGALIHRTHFEKVGLFDESLRYTQDIEMWFRLLQGKKSLWVSQKLFMVRVHPEADSKKYYNGLNQENARLYTELTQKLSDEELASMYGTAETGLCRMVGLIHSREGFEEANILEKRLKECYRVRGDDSDISRFKEYLKKISGDCQRKIVIFGAGQYGRRLLYELQQRQVTAAFFMDNDSAKDGTLIDGVVCKNVNDFLACKEDVLVIIAQRMCAEAVCQMKKLGFRWVITRQELDGILIRYSPYV